MSSKFAKKVIEEINSIRVKPTYIEKKLETMKTGLTRFKGNGAFVKEIENFIKSIGSMPKMTKVEQNDDLTKSAEEQLKKFLSDSNYAKYVRGNNMQGKIPDAYVEQNCCLIADDGAETEADVPIKILLNKMDKEKIGRQYLTNNDYTQIGVAHAMNSDDENCVVIILAKAPAGEESPLPEGDLSELKQAFDLFDVNKIGKIDPKETVGAMKSLNFDMKNPELFKIMKELDTPSNTWVDFPTFATHIIGKISDKKTDAGLRTIFNLFVDDPNNDTITLLTLKRIVKDLGEEESEDEVDRLLKNKGAANAHLTFDEFKAYMKKTYA